MQGQPEEAHPGSHVAHESLEEACMLYLNNLCLQLLSLLLCLLGLFGVLLGLSSGSCSRGLCLLLCLQCVSCFEQRSMMTFSDSKTISSPQTC